MRTFPLSTVKHVEIDQARKICQRLQESGHQAYFAGGAVRDLLLNRPVHDVDIATSAKPDDSLNLFDCSHFHGKSFGVVEVVYEQNHFQIATFRTESDYRDFRHPQTVEFSDAKSDALRRDFTINAIFLDPVSEEIFDYVDGLNDIATRQLRTVGKAIDRFQEDALRLLRAVRFLHTLPLNAAEDLLPSIQANAPLIKHISRERVFQELNRIFLESNQLSNAIQTLLETSLLNHIDEFFFTTEMPRELLVDRFKGITRIPAEVAWLLLSLPKDKQASAHPAIEFLRTLSCPNRILEAAEFVQQNRSKLDADTPLHTLEKMEIRDHRYFDILVEFSQIEQGSAKGLLPFQDLPETPLPLIKGHDLIHLGCDSSAQLGMQLRKLYQAQVDKEFSTQEDGLDWFRQNLQ